MHAVHMVWTSTTCDKVDSIGTEHHTLIVLGCSHAANDNGLADLLGVLDVQALGAVVAPGDAGEPVQVVAGDVEL